MVEDKLSCMCELNTGTERKKEVAGGGRSSIVLQMKSKMLTSSRLFSIGLWSILSHLLGYVQTRRSIHLSVRQGLPSLPKRRKLGQVLICHFRVPLQNLPVLIAPDPDPACERSRSDVEPFRVIKYVVPAMTWRRLNVVRP